MFPYSLANVKLGADSQGAGRVTLSAPFSNPRKKQLPSPSPRGLQQALLSHVASPPVLELGQRKVFWAGKNSSYNSPLHGSCFQT